jgi:hypothetical protein
MFARFNTRFVYLDRLRVVIETELFNAHSKCIPPFLVELRVPYFFFNSHSKGGGVQRGSLGTSATDWPIVPAPGDYDEGDLGGRTLGRENRSTPRKPAPAPLCPPQIPLDQTRAAAVGSQILTA